MLHIYQPMNDSFYSLFFAETGLTDYEQNVIVGLLESRYLCIQIHTHYYWLLVIIRLSKV